MNCHMAINDYHGERLQRADGTPVDPQGEIDKLYSYTGYDPQKGKYTREGHPIEWIKIHNLPDLVYFNHSQHVRAGRSNARPVMALSRKWMRSNNSPISAWAGASTAIAQRK
jgi:hypothetical protein